MITIELNPTVTHCIESTAKRAYNELLAGYLAGDSPDKDTEERAGLLLEFLNTADFKQLRRKSEPYLLEGKKVTFTLFYRGNEAGYTMEIA